MQNILFDSLNLLVQLLHVLLPTVTKYLNNNIMVIKYNDYILTL